MWLCECFCEENDDPRYYKVAYKVLNISVVLAIIVMFSESKLPTYPFTIFVLDTMTAYFQLLATT